MAATLEVLAPTGLTLTVKLYPYGSDVIANGAVGDTLTEATNRDGLYAATVAETLSGWHTAHIFSGALAIAVTDVYMEDGAVCRGRDHDPHGELIVPASGSDACTVELKIGLVPISDADVWVTSDAAGETVVEGTKQTDSNGRVTLLLTDGNTYYLWVQKDGINPIRGQRFVAVKD